jgi:hypothetical protein
MSIEASAALAEWIDIYREDPDGRLYGRLVNGAVRSLTMPRKTSRLKVTEFAALAKPEIAERVVGMADPARLEHVRADVARHASRVLAYALLKTAWRNGPLEEIHAGRYRGYPLDQRRVSAAEERELMGFASERLALGMTVCRQLATERPGGHGQSRCCRAGSPRCSRSRRRWTLTESSREVRLPA